jgi:hypothetical protein
MVKDRLIRSDPALGIRTKLAAKSLIPFALTVPSPEMQELVKSTIPLAWPGAKAAGSPLNRPRLPIRSKGFHEIWAGMMGQFPQKLRTPKE